MKKIVILDGKTLGELDFTKLREFGELAYYDTTKPEEVVERIKDANIVLTNKVVLNENNLKEAKNLELICETATGFNNIDIVYAKNNNIAVTNVAGYSTNTVAQHTFATVLSLYDKLSYYDNYVKSGDYAKSGLFTNVSKPFYELEGKTWGIIGFGAIGKRVAKIAEVFGVNVIYYSTSGKNSNSEYKRVDFKELLDQSDIISIHAPLNKDTQGLINYDALKNMKKSSILVNMGRGPIVVEADLAKALDEELIAGAALDVFEVEPIKEDNPLISIRNKENLVVTPHIAWASVEARVRLFEEVINNIKAFYNGEIRGRVEL
ncbi:D-2-hydroxyacid dehydrogenase [Clostridium tertium]|jgi:lactate dehydrogenase-like 2-hydroxyacid dehydrogenase|uniref:D-2-hydroxyacid dehydrogenase n=1 Tax=Clostridium TaxID=1485 RepID=UPI001156D0E2|nr:MULTISPECIES: D-2-hydroxyacid dehydrogenase [Clostridium]MDB1922886.1 D-2-hydroxyacid dehydrogenase [Clostridium tertium]MDB1927778.1 D-2-hydroxyacid dehydrogenase [Clostridium tertium]MDB1929139.1 D-2-hydroxyacid dehydrogenase [Clostridium tertium]MDB1932678.1 D-2-hydroxyacid dehydrogenase [Clostridium tertium]MDB1935985.1 D-2-hydroxyacid dehydrogenase [Clostridium tertium]